MAVLLRTGQPVNLPTATGQSWLATATSVAEAGLSSPWSSASVITSASDLAARWPWRCSVCMVSSPVVVMRVSEIGAQGRHRSACWCCRRSTRLCGGGGAVVLGLLRQVHGNNALEALRPPLWFLLNTLVLAILHGWRCWAARRRLDLANENSALLLGDLPAAWCTGPPVGASPSCGAAAGRHAAARRDPRPAWPRHFGTAGGALVVLLFVANGMAADWRLIVGGPGG